MPNGATEHHGWSESIARLEGPETNNVLASSTPRPRPALDDEFFDTFVDLICMDISWAIGRWS